MEIRKRLQILGIVLLAGGVLGGCAVQKSVVIPPDWSKERPQAPSARQPSEQIAAPGSAAMIRETNIPSENAETGSQGTLSRDEPKSPQLLASTQLVKQANLSLQRGAVDEAMSLYEQAIQIDVYNGGAFYGLARAWYQKGNYSQALEFAHKAEILFQDRPERLKSVYLLEARIYRALDDNQAASVYAQKAERLQ